MILGRVICPGTTTHIASVTTTATMYQRPTAAVTAMRERLRRRARRSREAFDRSAAADSGGGSEKRGRGHLEGDGPPPEKKIATWTSRGPPDACTPPPHTLSRPARRAQASLPLADPLAWLPAPRGCRGVPYASLRVRRGTPYVSTEDEAAIMILPTARQRALARCRVAKGVPLLEALEVPDLVAELGLYGQPGDQ